jgi:exopolysaccharide biosynthesis polyprenyl glycosylphosphotransferase
MFRRFSVNFAIFSIIVDCVTIDGILWLTSHYRSWFNALSFVLDNRAPILLPWVLYVIFPLTWLMILASFNVYDGTKNLRLVDEYASLTLSSTLAGVTMAGILYLLYPRQSRIVFIAFVLFAYIALMIWRSLIRIPYRWRHGNKKRIQRILIAGAGILGRDVESRMRTRQYLGIELIGFLDDDSSKRSRLPDVLGTLDDVRSIVASRQVNDVIIALPPRAHERVNQIVTILHDLPVRVWLIPDYFNLVLHHAEVADFVGIPMFDLRAPALSEVQRLIKRAFDIILGLLILVPFLPVMGIIALVILVDDGPPVLFRQKRVGENGRLFAMYKFRSMVKNAEQLQSQVQQKDENGNIVHKRRDDPRVTRVGRLLRRLSLDELPQFFNVLRGTLSLVGPRPELPYLVEKYQPWQRKRFAVPQGMTGWWQIHGRSDKPMHLHTEDDLFYVQNYSIWLDIQILIRTFWIVLRGKGAY